MHETLNRRTVLPLLAAAVLLPGSGCSLKFRVQENWGADYRRPIPLEAAAATWAEIRAGGTPADDSLEDYNRAVRSSVVHIAENWLSDSASLSAIRTTQGDINLGVRSVNVRAIDLVDRIVPADFVTVKRGFRSETVVEGVGASLMVRQPPTPEDPMLPETGIWYPVTAVLDLDQPDQPVLKLIDPTKQSDLLFNGHRLPLSANYTASFARDFQDRQRLIQDFPAMLNFEKWADRMGLYRVSAFDPDKQVCVLVHGVNSSPMTWNRGLNEIYADEAVRERYEFWTFAYPTGAPIHFLAAEFRRSLVEMQEFRRRNGARHERIRIVGHSMGGLLAKAVTQSSGDEEWFQLFNAPPEELNISESHREKLRRMFYYEPLPFIDRVVFCATPHRGSQFAANPGAKLVSSIIQVPVEIANISTEILSQSRHLLTPLGFEITAEQRTSLQGLRPGSQYTAALLDKPLHPAVSYHSIIGRMSPPWVPLEKSGDGLVPYESASIEGVESEKVVENSPHAVHRKPGGIEEIIRILRLP